jgi:uncharacterized membrane protein YciS (DUF1049 family)
MECILYGLGILGGFFIIALTFNYRLLPQGGLGLAASLAILLVLTIPINVIFLSFKRIRQKNKILELELQKEILKLEIDKQHITVKLPERKWQRRRK